MKKMVILLTMVITGCLLIPSIVSAFQGKGYSSAVESTNSHQFSLLRFQRLWDFSHPTEPTIEQGI